MNLSTVGVLLLSAFLAGSAAHAQARDVVVARAGGHEITFDQLAGFAEDGLYHYLVPTRSEALERALQDLIVEELKRIDLFASGLANDSALVRSVSRNVTEELVLAYAKHKYEDHYLNEATIRAEHARMGRVVLYREIVLRKPADAEPADLDSLRSIVSDLSRQVGIGHPLDAQYSAYHGVANERPVEATSRITWDQTLASPRAGILFDLSPGDTRSFESPTSFSVARIEKIERVDVPPIEEVRDRIVDALNRRHAAGATRAFRAEWDQLIDTTSLQWHSEGLEQFVSWSNTPGFFEGSYESIVRNHLTAKEDATIFSDGRGELRLSHLSEILENILTPGSSGGHDNEFAQEFVLEAIRTLRLAERARASGHLEDIWRPNTTSPVLGRAFVQFYNQKNIEELLPDPTEGALLEFYNNFSDSLFFQLARVNTQIILRQDEDEIAALWERLQRGEAFEDLSHRRLIRSFERTRDGEIVTRFNPEPPYLGAVAFGLQEGEYAGPVSYEDARLGRVFAIVHATKRLEERQLSFDEVRDGIEDVFIEHHRKELAAKVDADLRSRYPVIVYREALAEALTMSPRGAPANGVRGEIAR